MLWLEGAASSHFFQWKNHAVNLRHRIKGYLQEELAAPVLRTPSFSSALLDAGLSWFVNLISQSPELVAETLRGAGC